MLSAIAVFLIKSFLVVYSYITLPLYYLVQQPWREVSKSHHNRIIRDASSADTWRRPDDFTNDYNRVTPPLLGCKTLSQLISLSCSLYRSRRCLGYRETLESQECTDAMGRQFYKKRFADEYTWLTYDQVDERIDNLAAGLLMAGCKPGQTVALIMDGCIEWTLSALAVTRIGAILVTVFPAISSSGINDVLEETCTSVIITDVSTARHKITKESLSKLSSVKVVTVVTSSATQLQQLIDDTYNFNGEKRSDLSMVTFDQLEVKGKDARDALYTSTTGDTLIECNNNDQHVDEMRQTLSSTLSYPSPKATDKALIMYSSGTTGKPKGVVYLQGHFVHAYHIGNEAILSDRLGTPNQQEVYLSFLPPSHVFEFTIQFCFIASGASIGFGSPFTAFPKGVRLLPGCLPDVQALNPTFVIVVPLLLERMRASIEQQLSSKPRILEALVKLAINYRFHWKSKGYSSPLIERLLLKKTTQMLFGNRITKIITGSAPLSADTQRFLSGLLTANLRQGYGMTEAFALVSVCDGSDWSVGTVGSLHPGIKIKLRDWIDGAYHSTDSPFPRGELLIGGKHVSCGYFKRIEETKSNFFLDKQGLRWYVTGDIVELNTHNGTLRIIDRKKDLVKMANGEFISLGKIESALKLNAFVENIYIHACSNSLVAFILPNVDTVTSVAHKLLHIEGNSNNLQMICTNEQVTRTVLESLRETARKANLSPIETPKQIYLEWSTWTPENGLVTATLKVRRKQLEHYYEKTIAELTLCK